MDTDKIENDIAQKIIDKITTKPGLSDDEIEKAIVSEISTANYLTEDWQTNYAKQRILKMIEPIKSICPFCGSGGKKYRPDGPIWGFVLWSPIFLLLPKFRCLKCKKTFPEPIKNKNINLAVKVIIILIIIWFIFGFLSTVISIITGKV